MSFSDWFSIFLIAILGAVSPGPSLMVVVKNTLGGGSLNGIFTAWAHAFGILVYAILTILGLAILLKENQLLFNLVSYSGAIYLAWLGYKALSSKGGISNKLQKGKKNSYLTSAKEGIMISILNPKIGLFFIALFSQFIHPEVNTFGKIITALTPFITDGLWYTFIALIISNSKILPILQSKAKLIDKITGVLFIFVALKILYS